MTKKIYTLKQSQSPKNFNINYQEELNPEQLQVVTEGDGYCLVLAGAGSGKTRTLVYRVSYLLEKGVSPDNILLMTFTNKAAKEMINRVESLVGSRIKGIWAGTFHHIGNRILRQHINKLGYDKNYSILDESDSRDLLKNIISEKNIKDIKLPKPAVIKNIISLSVNSGLAIDKVIAKYYPYLEEYPIEIIKQIAANYKEQKKKLNALDYDDLLAFWLKLLQQYPEFKQRLGQKFKYILIDEYQDTNLLQAQIITELGNVSGNVLVVGDDAQSIYSFRAALIENILSFPQKFPQAKIFRLETNYRSSPEILNLANNSIKHNQAQFPKQLKPIKVKGRKPTVVTVQNNDQQAEFITQRIIELNQDEGVDLKDMAVLFRADFHALELELALNKKNIPYIKRGGIKFFEQAHLKDILAFLKILHNPEDLLSWQRVLLMQPGIGPESVKKITSHFAQKDIKQITAIKETLSRKAEMSWQAIAKIIEKASSTKNNKIADIIQIVLNNFYIEYARQTFDNAEQRLEDINQLINISDSYSSLTDFLHDITLSENFSAERTRDGSNLPDDYLILSTIHQAKGLEWKVVFVINLVSGQFPHSKAMNSQTEIEEERRLFYVACTRAQDQLYLVYPTVNYNHNYGFIISTPSEFLQELDPDLYEEWQTVEEERVIDIDDEDKKEYLPPI